jgi:DNA (cytosine-5)-methyltransferase 1
MGAGTMNFRLGELYSGPGGLGLGASLANVEKNGESYTISHVWASDYDKDSCDTYQDNICPDVVLCQDVHKLNISALPKIDCFVFGFPCNDFSVVGEQKGINGTYGSLYSYGIKVVKHFQPQWFLAENVGGLRNASDGKVFEMVLNDMFEAGYNIVPHLYKFEEYGVPQARHRIIIVGIRKDLGIGFNVPAPTHQQPMTCRKALEEPPISADTPNHEYTKHAKHVIERLKYIKPGENAFTAQMPENLQLNVNGAKISQIYKRLDPNRPAYTVTGSGGGGTHVYHWHEDRALTNRERARLQTFPDDFVFRGSKESVRKQIGMAVPPMGVKIIFEAILKSFANIKYSFVYPLFPSLLHIGTIKSLQKVSDDAFQLRFLEQQESYQEK